MTKNEIITALFLSKDFDDCINSRCPMHLKDDLKAEIALLMCEKDEKQLQSLQASGQLRFFVVRIILNQLGKNGPFYKKYRQSMSEVKEQACFPADFQVRIRKEAFEDAIVKEVETDLTWYEKGILELYLKMGALRKVAKHTCIPHSSVHLTINEIRRKIQSA